MYEAWREIHRLFLTANPTLTNKQLAHKAIDIIEPNVQEVLKKISTLLDSPILEVEPITEYFKQLIFNLHCIQHIEPQGISSLFKLIKAHYLFGFFYKKIGNSPLAEFNFGEADHLCKDLLALSNDHIDTLRLQARIQNELKHFDRAISILEHILTFEGKNHQDFFLMGFLLNIQEKENLDALTFLDQTECFKKEVMLQKAIAHRKQEHYQEAEYHLQNAIAIDSGFAQAYKELAYLKLKQNDIFTAIPWAKQALKLDPSLLQAASILSDAYEHLGDYDKALEIWQTSNQDAHPFVLFRLANLYYDMQRFAEAFETIHACKEQLSNPKISATYHMQQGHFLKALEILETNNVADSEDDIHICALKLSSALQLSHRQKITDYSNKISELLSFETMKQDYEEASDYLNMIASKENNVQIHYGRAMVLFTQTCLMNLSYLLNFYNSQIFLQLTNSSDPGTKDFIANVSTVIKSILLIFRKMLTIYLETENHALAISYLSLIDKLDNLSEEEQNQLEQCQQKTTQHKKTVPYHAKEIFKQLVFFYELQTFYYLSREEIEPAFIAAKKACRLDTQSYALNLLGAWHKEQQRNYEEALADLTGILTHHFKYQMNALANLTYDPEESYNPILASLFAIQARCYYKTEQSSKAFEVMQWGLVFDSSSQELKILLAHHHLENKNYADALTLVTEILALAPNDINALNIRACVASLKDRALLFTNVLPSGENSLLLQNYANQLHLAIKDQLSVLQLVKNFSPLTLKELIRLKLLTEHNEALEEILADKKSTAVIYLHQCSMSFFTQKVAKSFLSLQTSDKTSENNPKVRDLISASQFISPLPIHLLGRKRKAGDLTQFFEERPSKKVTSNEQDFCIPDQTLMNS